VTITIRRFAFRLTYKTEVSELDDKNQILFRWSIWRSDSRYRLIVVETSSGYKNILRFHVAMKVPKGVDIVEARHSLVEDGGDEPACKWPTLAGFD